MRRKKHVYILLVNIVAILVTILNVKRIFQNYYNIAKATENGNE